MKPVRFLFNWDEFNRGAIKGRYVKMTELVPAELIANKIYLIRDVKVMLDRDLAELYGWKPKYLNKQLEEISIDFMFEMTKSEFEDWRSQFATSNQDIMVLNYKQVCFPTPFK